MVGELFPEKEAAYGWHAENQASLVLRKHLVCHSERHSDKRELQTLKTNHLFHSFTSGLSYVAWESAQPAPSSLNHSVYIHYMHVKYSYVLNKQNYLLWFWR